MSTSLKPFNTFGIQANASRIVIAETVEQLKDTWSEAVAANMPVLILGEGSNVLFLEDYSGTVIINRISGIEVTEEKDAWHLHVGAGENWHHLVENTLQQGMPGLENLALIPGCAGSSPIQNIGAYGVELKNVCHYVDCIDLISGEIHRLDNSQCQFGYRDSIFKHEYQSHYAIIAVGLRLPKQWQPVLSYGDSSLGTEHYRNVSLKRCGVSSPLMHWFLSSACSPSSPLVWMTSRPLLQLRQR